MRANFSPDLEKAIQRKAIRLAKSIGLLDEEDCRQEICLFLLNRMRCRGVTSLEAGAIANTWILDAASKLVKRMGRKKRFQTNSDVPFEPHHKCTMPDTSLEDDEEKQLVSAKFREAVDAGIRLAKSDDKAILGLIYKAGLKQAEVAGFMDRAVSGINKKKKRFEDLILKALLRRRLGERCPGESCFRDGGNSRWMPVGIG